MSVFNDTRTALMGSRGYRPLSPTKMARRKSHLSWRYQALQPVAKQ